MDDIRGGKGSDLFPHERNEQLLRGCRAAVALALLRKGHKCVDGLALHVVGNPAGTSAPLGDTQLLRPDERGGEQGD